MFAFPVEGDTRGVHGGRIDVSKPALKLRTVEKPYQLNILRAMKLVVGRGSWKKEEPDRTPVYFADEDTILLAPRFGTMIHSGIQPDV